MYQEAKVTEAGHGGGSLRAISRTQCLLYGSPSGSPLAHCLLHLNCTFTQHARSQNMRAPVRGGGRECMGAPAFPSLLQPSYCPPTDDIVHKAWVPCLRWVSDFGFCHPFPEPLTPLSDPNFWLLKGDTDCLFSIGANVDKPHAPLLFT